MTFIAVVEENPKNLILLLADGFGPASLTMAREGVGRNLTLDNHLVGIIKTQSANRFVMSWNPLDSANTS